MILSTNLLGFLVRGLFINPELNKLKSETKHKFLKQEIEKNQRADKWTNVIALILIILYFYLLIHFWNIGVAIVAAVIMADRLPDLVWEIKNYNGKLSFRNAKLLLPKSALSKIIGLDFIVLIPLLYYFLYHFNK